MQMLDVDQNKKLNIPDLYKNIVRTGTVPEGSCFLHSILKATNKDDYSDMTKKEKINYMKKIRKELAESLSLEYYKNNMISISSFGLSLELSIFLKKIYHFIENPQDFLLKNKFIIFLTDIINNNIVAFKMITTVISEKEFVGIIDSPFVTSSNTIDEYIRNYNTSLFQMFIQKLNEEDFKLSEDRLEICKSKIKRFVESTCDFIIDKQFQEYKKDLENTSKWASDLIFQLISDYMNVDIYFIDINKKDIYTDHLIKKNRSSVVVGWLNDNHFENIGVLENKHIKRLFEPDHPFIIKLKEKLKL